MSLPYPLHVIRVASPCPASWDAMTGNDQVRFCGRCQKHVYNLSEMTSTEAAAVIWASERRTCVRFYQRRDGTVITADCPVGVAAWRKRWGIVGGSVAALVVLTLGIATAVASTRRADHGRSWRNVPPISTVRNWFFPRPVVVMGDIGPPLPPPSAPSPGPDAETVEQEPAGE